MGLASGKTIHDNGVSDHGQTEMGNPIPASGIPCGSEPSPIKFDRAVLRSLTPAPSGQGGNLKDGPVLSEEPCGPVDYILIGEAPGKQEVIERRPFCGASGRLLRELVKAAGLTNVHYTNAYSYRPPVRGGKDTKPTQKMLQSDKARLFLEIAMLRPKAVVALGATAAYALCGQVPRSRGMVVYVTYLGFTFPVYITRHPAAVFYDPDYYVDLVNDLERCAKGETPSAVRFDSSGGYEPGTTPLLFGYGGLVPTFRGETIYVDTEATSTHFPSADLLCVAVSDSIATYLFEPTPEGLAFLRRAISEFHGQIVGQNTAGDEILLRRYGIPIRFTGDTLLRHYSQDERKGSHGLKVLAPTLAQYNTAIDKVWPYTHKTGVGVDDEGEDERAKGWGSIPKPVLYEYCATDAFCTARVDKALGLAEDARAGKVYGFTRRAMRAFTEGMYKGVRVDREKGLEELRNQTEKVNEAKKAFDFDPNKREEVLKALNAAGHKVSSTAKPALQGLRAELPDRILAYRKEEKLLTGFLRPLMGWTDERGIVHPGWVGADGIVHPSYRLFGTESGRTSCREPNVQQIPQALKALFIPREGHVFIGWDMKQHEVRGIAYLSRDKALCSLLRDPNVDPHDYVGKAAGVDRSIGKRSLFAVAYGASVEKLVSIGIPKEDAQRGIAAVKALLPGLEPWRKEVIKTIWEQGYLETPYGRRRHFWYINQRTRHHQERVGVNFLPQSFCGDICMDGAIQVFEQAGYAPLVFVHDFNMIEVEEDKADELAGICARIAGGVYPNDLVDFIPEVKIGMSWGDLHKPEEEDDAVEERT